MLKLSIIGCGNVAKTVGYLWYQSKKVEIVDVVNRSQTSADASVDFIGSGRGLAKIDDLKPADIFMISCGDDHIESCLNKVIEQSVIQENAIVFHFSGAKNSHVLSKATKLGAKCASLHPVKSFANPTDAIESFTDTYCGLEGDIEACDVLKKLIESVGGHSFEVDGDRKLTYHAASVFACNYLTVLQELSLRSLEQSGVGRELGMKILEPIVKETSKNVFKLGTANALTGPIARGDSQLVSEQFKAIKDWDKNAGEIYRSLGKVGVDLSEEKGIAQKNDLNDLRQLFE